MERMMRFLLAIGMLGLFLSASPARADDPRALARQGTIGVIAGGLGPGPHSADRGAAALARLSPRVSGIPLAALRGLVYS